MLNFKFKFPTIRHFHQVLKEYNKLGLRGEVNLVGHPKIHGSNTNVAFHADGTITAHTKEILLSEQENCAGFYQFVQERLELFKELRDFLLTEVEGLKYPFALSGEWAGGRIQGSASTADLPLFWSPFAVSNIVEETDEQGNVGNHLQFKNLPGAMLTTKSANIVDAREFGRYDVKLDVSFPEKSQNFLADLTKTVEMACPVAKYFGVDSDKGEGVVWHCSDLMDRHLYFKVKGQKHSTAKVRKLANVNPERVSGISEFVDYAVTENRMKQAVNETGGLSKENLGKFMKWLHADIIKEETEVMTTNGIEYGVVQARISTKALAWYRNQL